MDATTYPTATGQIGTHPLFKNTSSSLKIHSNTKISLSYSTLANVARYDPLVYFRSVYEWVTDLASFSILNPETARRLVIYRSFILVLILILVCWCDFGGAKLRLLSCCCCYCAQIYQWHVYDVCSR